jgi:hypothetical protein
MSRKVEVFFRFRNFSRSNEQFIMQEYKVLKRKKDDI